MEKITQISTPQEAKTEEALASGVKTRSMLRNFQLSPADEAALFAAENDKLRVEREGVQTMSAIASVDCDRTEEEEEEISGLMDNYELKPTFSDYVRSGYGLDIGKLGPSDLTFYQNLYKEDFPNGENSEPEESDTEQDEPQIETPEQQENEEDSQEEEMLNISVAASAAPARYSRASSREDVLEEDTSVGVGGNTYEEELSIRYPNITPIPDCDTRLPPHFFSKPKNLINRLLPRSFVNLKEQEKMEVTACPENATYYVGNRLRYGQDVQINYMRHSLLRSDMQDIKKPNFSKVTEYQNWIKSPAPEFFLVTANRFQALEDLEDDYYAEMPDSSSRKETKKWDKRIQGVRKSEKAVKLPVPTEEKTFKESYHKREERCSLREPKISKARGGTLEDRIKNHQAAYTRINTKIRIMPRNELIEYVLTHKITEVTLRAIEKHHDWVFDWVTAIKHGDMGHYLAFSILTKKTKLDTLNECLHISPEFGPIIRGFTPAERGWVRQLTDDGDIEANPGPMGVMRDMEEVARLEDITESKTYVEVGVGPSSGLYSYSHELIAAAQDPRGRVGGSVAASLTPRLGIETGQGITMHDQGMPLQETTIYPRQTLGPPNFGVNGGPNVLPPPAGNDSAPWTFTASVRLSPDALTRVQRASKGRRTAALPAGRPIARVTLSDGRGTLLSENILSAGQWGRSPAGAGLPSPAFQIDLGGLSQNGQWHYPAHVRGNPTVLNIEHPTPIIKGTFECQPWAAGGVPVDDPNTMPAEPNRYNLTTGSPIMTVANDYSYEPNIPTVETKLMTEAREWLEKNTVITHRADVLPMGFRKYDVMVMAEACHATHLSNEMLIIKHCMLEGVRLLRDGAPEIWSPLEGTSTPLLPWTAVDIDQDQNRLFSFNGSPLVNENCGGSDPCFPFCGDNVKGSITFHSGLSTIPTDFSNTIAVSSDLCGGPQSQEMLAWMIGLHAPWPWCNLGMWIDTFDITDRQKQSLFYNWTGGMCFIDGETNIHVVLPRRTGIRVTNEREARAASSIVPTFGPVATQDYPAYYEMNITPDVVYSDDEVVSYPLSDYLYSWMGEITTSPILSRAYRYLLSSGLVADESKMMSDVPSIFWGRTGSKPVYARGARVAPDFLLRSQGLAVNSEPALRTWAWHCGEIPRLDPMTSWTNWRPSVWDASLPAVNLRGNLAVIMGLRKRESAYQVPCSLAEKPNWYVSAYLGFRLLAVTWGLFHHIFALDYSSLDAIYHGHLASGLPQATMRLVYSIMTQKKARGQLKIYGFMTEIAGTTVTHSLSYQQPITVAFHQPRSWTSPFCSSDYQNTYDRAIAQMYPDPYIHMACRRKTFLRFAPFVLPGAGLPTQGLDITDGQEKSFQGHAGPVYKNSFPVGRTFSNDWVRTDDRETWNERIAYGLRHWQISYLSNGMAPIGVIPPNHFPSVFTWVVAPNSNVPPALNHHTDWLPNTLTVPKIDWETTETMTIQSTLANPVEYRQALNGSGSVHGPCWLYTHVGSGVVSATNSMGGRANMEALLNMLSPLDPKNEETPPSSKPITDGPNPVGSNAEKMEAAAPPPNAFTETGNTASADIPTSAEPPAAAAPTGQTIIVNTA